MLGGHKNNHQSRKKYKHILIHTRHKWHQQSKMHAEFKQTCFWILLQKQSGRWQSGNEWQTVNESAIKEVIHNQPFAMWTLQEKS